MAMYGRPLLRDDRVSNLRYTVLLNPPLFHSHEHFQAEYVLMPDEKPITDHFSLVRIPNPTLEKADPASIELMLRRMGAPSHMKDCADFMSEGYIVWEARPVRKLTRNKDLMPRPALEKWLHAHFLKICVPYPREPVSDRPTNAPLNITAFIRLVAHLAEIGYPVHWLSQILCDICTRQITTTAHPPVREVTTPADVYATHPPQTMITTPWHAEFTTMLSIWNQLLPFGGIFPPNSLVSPSEIGEYTVRFPDVKRERMRVPHFVLVFWNAEQAMLPEDEEGFLWVLLSEDKDDPMLDAARGFKDALVHIVTAMTYVAATKTASFWYRSDAIEFMKSGGWKVYIWRVDRWERVTKGIDVKNGLTLKRRWDE